MSGVLGSAPARKVYKGLCHQHGRHVLDGKQVMTAYHDLWRVEESFRMAKSDLKARPVIHRKRDSIEAHSGGQCTRRPRRCSPDNPPDLLAEAVGACRHLATCKDVLVVNCFWVAPRFVGGHPEYVCPAMS